MRSEAPLAARMRPNTLDDIRRSLPERTEIDRQLILVELADHLEKYVDLGLLYFGDNAWVESERMADGLIAIAGELGQPRLAEMLSSAIAEAATVDVPAELRTSDGRSFLKLEVPRSCRRKLAPRVRKRIRRALRG